MIKISALGQGFEITRNGRLIYSATPGSELFEVGRGSTSFEMSRGSFDIQSTLKSRKKIKLRSAVTGKDSIALLLTEGEAVIRINGDRIDVSFSGFEQYNRLFFTMPALHNEKVYGSGETFSEFNLRGNRFNVWVAEHQNSRVLTKKVAKTSIGFKNSKHKDSFSSYETYYAQPTFLSSRKYYFHSFTTARAVFDFTHRSRHTLEFDSVSPFCIGFGDTFEDVISSLTAVVGRQPALPDWVYDGAILGIQGGTDTMLSKYHDCLKHKMNVTGIWIQDWEGRRITSFGKQLMWNWEWDRELYPDLDKAIANLNDAGVKVLGYCNPFLAIEKPLYAYASEKGYCVKDKDGKDYLVKITTFPAAMLDLTNPEAWDWMKDIIKKNMIDFGLSGWMADFGEYLPTDCVLWNGADAALVHNTWPAMWARLNREAVEESGRLGEIMFFTRAGSSDTPRYSTMMWNGDNHVDFSLDNGLPSVIPAMLSLTCSGFGLSHSDIGGYTTFGKLCRSEELYMRWCELSAFTPVMRSHEGNNPDLNAQFDASSEVLDHQAKMTRVHVALKPYIKALVENNAETGVGVVRPLFFHYNEQRAFEESYEFMLGREILVAPVIRPKAKTKEVYLPEDEWIHLATGRQYNGGVVSVDAPLGCPPVFYRKNCDKKLKAVFEAAAKEFKNGKR